MLDDENLTTTVRVDWALFQTESRLKDSTQKKKNDEADMANTRHKNSV